MRATCVSVALLSVPPTLAAQLPQRCERAQGTSAYSIEVNLGYHHDRFNTQPKDLFRELAAFVASFDSADDDDGDGVADIRGIPEWVAYEIKPFRQAASGQFDPATSQGVERPSPWYEHADLSFVLDQPGVTSTSIDDSYRNSGFDRGHLAMRAHANRIGWQEGCNTHFFLNAVAQEPEFNRGIWRDLENHTGAWANKYGRVWVIVGPVFPTGQTPQTIGDVGEAPIVVPPALFKIVARNDPDSDLPVVLAFIYPQNHPAYGSTACNPPYPHEQFLVSIAEIESATGLRFFQDLTLTAEQRAAFVQGKASELWPVKSQDFGLTC